MQDHYTTDKADRLAGQRRHLVSRRRRRVFTVVDDGTRADDLPDWLVVTVHEHVTRRGVGPRAAGVVQAQQLQEVTRPHCTRALCVKPDVTTSDKTAGSCTHMNRV